MKLPNNLLLEFSDALLDAYPDISNFDALLFYRLETPRPSISLGNTIPNIILDVITYFQCRDRTTDFLIAARQSNPDNVKLLEVAIKAGADIKLSVQNFNGSQIQSIENTRELERIIRPANPELKIVVFKEKLGQIEGRICRIEYVNSDGKQIYGTGFLIGPDLLLTNYHVMEEVINNHVSSESVKCRFDYKELADGTILSGNIVKLSEQNWLVDYSNYSELDLTDTLNPLPEENELDYALLSLQDGIGDKPIGNNPEPNAAKRGWIDLSDIDYPFETDSGIIIVQHPEGEPLKLTIDTQSLILVNDNKTRVRYRTNTEKGSSGSPCFNMNLDIVALHHSGDPNFEQFHHPTYNQGIPISKIFRLISDRRQKDD